MISVPQRLDGGKDETRSGRRRSDRRRPPIPPAGRTNEKPRRKQLRGSL